MLIHRAVIHQRIRNWAPFLVTECRFQDTRGCSEIVCQQASGGEKVEATLLFSVKHQKGKDTPTSRNRLRRNLAYFRQKQPPKGVFQTTPKRSQGVKVVIMTKIDLFKKWKNKNFGADFTDFVGEAVRKQTHFLQKNMFYHPVSVYHRGWIGLAVGCTQFCSCFRRIVMMM